MQSAEWVVERGECRVQSAEWVVETQSGSWREESVGGACPHPSTSLHTPHALHTHEHPAHPSTPCTALALALALGILGIPAHLSTPLHTPPHPCTHPTRPHTSPQTLPTTKSLFAGRRMPARTIPTLVRRSAGFTSACALRMKVAHGPGSVLGRMPTATDLCGAGKDPAASNKRQGGEAARRRGG